MFDELKPGRYLYAERTPIEGSWGGGGKRGKGGKKRRRQENLTQKGGTPIKQDSIGQTPSLRGHKLMNP